jgi:hypothetical protein
MAVVAVFRGQLFVQLFAGSRKSGLRMTVRMEEIR